MPIRLSHSAVETLHTCERKFELERFILPRAETPEENADFSFGTAFGAALQEYLQTHSIDRAIFKGFLAYHPFVETDKKSLWKLVYSLLKSEPVLKEFCKEYELVEFKGKPAVELGVKVNIDADYYYVGFVDAVVRHKTTKKYSIIEGKTTGSILTDLRPMYQHSGQGIGYSIALDAIVGEDYSTYSIIYPVLQYPGRANSEPSLHLLQFEKTLLDRLQWFITLQMDVNHIKEMLQLKHFPKRISGCLAYNRPCPHFGLCQLHTLSQHKKEEPDPHEARYSFSFNLSDLITSHLERIKHG